MDKRFVYDELERRKWTEDLFMVGKKKIGTLYLIEEKRTQRRLRPLTKIKFNKFCLNGLFVSKFCEG